MTSEEEESTNESDAGTCSDETSVCLLPPDSPLVTCTSAVPSNKKESTASLDFSTSDARCPNALKSEVVGNQSTERSSSKDISENNENHHATDDGPGPPPLKKYKRDSESNDADEPTDAKETQAGSSDLTVPIVPELVPSPSHAIWVARRDCLILRKDSSVKENRTKAAAFDLDQTLLLWRCAGWPSKPEHYELWSSSVVTKLQKLSDEGYQLIIFSNQGGIRSAIGGKTATRVKGLIEWIASKLNRPLFAAMSTKSKSGYHKPSPQMWQICEQECNAGVEFDLESSFYVGDSDGKVDDSSDAYQEKGVDKLFAENVGKLRDQVLRFQNPVQFFGQSDLERRQKSKLDAKLSSMPYEKPPAAALTTRAALLGGYLQGPIMLILCGVQGSGKSFFCQELVRASQWVHLSQDTVANGKPGKREKVEQATLEALQKGDSVVIDRMHLDIQQRSYFFEVAKVVGNIPVHVLWFNVPSHIVKERVRSRTNHPGGVQGDRGAKLALASMEKLVPPTYREGFSLLSVASNPHDVEHFSRLYSLLCPNQSLTYTSELRKHFSVRPHKDDDLELQLPSISFGTQKLGKRVASSVVSLAIQNGFRAFDTAPTYNNESEIGVGISSQEDIFVVAKVPKRAIQPAEVRAEVLSSLKRLQRTAADLVLLHWPCDFIEAGSLGAVWKVLEEMVSECHIKALGVSNFSVDALRALLPFCTSVWPVVNQVERHPLLPQWEVLDFCACNNIILQAHTCLGQGRDELLRHPALVKVATEANRTTSQVIVEWNLRQGVAVVTKCASEVHMHDLLHLLTAKPSIDADGMELLDSVAETSQLRLVAPPFMYKPGAPYSWGQKIPVPKK